MGEVGILLCFLCLPIPPCGATPGLRLPALHRVLAGPCAHPKSLEKPWDLGVAHEGTLWLGPANSVVTPLVGLFVSSPVAVSTLEPGPWHLTLELARPGLGQ